MTGGLWRQVFTRNMLICVFTGFSSGMPLFLLLNLVPAWLKKGNVDLVTIAALWVFTFPYTWKFLWSPLLDRYALPGLGRRRGWMLVTQLGLLVAIAACGYLPIGHLAPPKVEWLPFAGWHYPVFDMASVSAFVLHPVTLMYFLIALLSATQDIALDAYRRELLSDAELGLGNSVHVNAYRVASLVPGSLAFILADHLSWNLVFTITGLFMLPGVAMTLLVSEPHRANPPRTLRQAVVEPFHEFFTRNGWRNALLVLTFILLYKLGGSLCTALATPFYMDMGFSLTEIGLVAKYAGFSMALVGGILGGLWMLRIGINRALWLFGAVQVVSILGFAWLAWHGHHDHAGAAQLFQLAIAVGFEALGVGLGTAAYVAYVARTTNPAYTATQLALFTSLEAMPRTFMNAASGWLVEHMGWTGFFLLCTALSLPGMLLLFKVAPWNAKPAP
jgi:MFS transporter, PAT family, beta-lactamase induction signal transducer AmpG